MIKFETPKKAVDILKGDNTKKIDYISDSDYFKKRVKMFSVETEQQITTDINALVVAYGYDKDNNTICLYV